MEARGSRTDNLRNPPEFATVLSDGLTPTTAESRIVSTVLRDTADALELLTSAANDHRSHSSSDALSQVQVNYSISPVSENSARPTKQYEPTEKIAWAKFLPIKKGILLEVEVREYLDFYWKTLWPLKPVIPISYRDPSRYILLIEKEPILGMTLLVLTSRYHALTGPLGEIRSERIHYHTWKYLQKYLNSVLWGSTCTRSLGTIASLLLLIEWHSKAFNNPAELSDDLEGLASRSPSFLQGGQVPTASTLTIRERYELTIALERMNILSPVYRSNKISRLVQYPNPPNK